MHQQGSQIGIAAPAQSELSNFAARSGLSWYQPEPCSELTSRAESAGIAYGGDGSCRSEQANTGDFGNSLALLIFSKCSLESALQCGDVCISRLHAAPLLTQAVDQHGK